MFRLFLLIVFIFLPHNSWAMDEFNCETQISKDQWEEILSRVQKKYTEFNDLKAIFYQRSVFIALNQEQLSRGELSFKKPGKMDWHYIEPEVQRFVSDAESLWYYQPKLNQVTVSSFNQSFSSEVPVTFLLGLGELKNKFNVSSACKSRVGILLKLKPTVDDPQLQEFYLLVSLREYEPIGARVVDIGGNETEILLYRLQANTNIADEQFAFKIPSGTDVIQQTKSKQSTKTKLIGFE